MMANRNLRGLIMKLNNRVLASFIHVFRSLRRPRTFSKLLLRSRALHPFPLQTLREIEFQPRCIVGSSVSGPSPTKDFQQTSLAFEYNASI